MIGNHPFQPSLAAGICRRCGQSDATPLHDYTPVAVARRSDPDTSWEAARSVRSIRESQREVLAIFVACGSAGATDERAWTLYQAATPGGQSVSGFRTRRSELVAMGLLRDTGERRIGSTGRRMIVWGVA